MTHPFPTRRSSDLRKAHPPLWSELEPAVAVHIAAQVALACAGQRPFRRGNARAIGADAAALERPHRGHAPIFHLQRRQHFRSEEHTSELQSLMRNPYAVFCLKTKKATIAHCIITQTSVVICACSWC